MRTSQLLTRGVLLLIPVVALGVYLNAQAPARLALTSMRPAPASAAAPSLHISADPGARDVMVEVGPVDLPAHAHHTQLPALHATVPVDGWMHGFRVELVDAQGRPVPRRTLHHVNVIATGQRELFSQIMLRVAAAGQETAPVALPRMVGYRFRKGQELIVTAMLHNPTAQEYRGVKLRVHFPFTPAGAMLRPISVFPFYMDVMPPASLHSYALPTGRSSKSWEARPAISGRILGVSGHLHKYGTALRLEDVTAGRVLWEARPTLGADGDVVDMPQGLFFTTLGIPISRDHVYRLTAEYNNTSGAVIPGGGMGALGGAFAADEPETWPAVDRSHPELKLDWQLVHTGNQEGHGGGHHGAPAAPAGHGAAGHASHGAPSAAKPAAPASPAGHAHGVASQPAQQHHH